MKLEQVITLHGIFAARAKEVYSVQLALKILKFKKATAAEAEFYAERQRHILSTCAKTDEGGKFIFTESGGILLRLERAEEYRKQMAELDETETDAQITFTAPDLEELKLTLEELEAAADFIEEEKDDGRGNT
ncbi:MAG: hypothetical protein IJW79_00210 [Clostridia bacterium]|nr:hypothetical protein [Clostridia bacterium]